METITATISAPIATGPAPADTGPVVDTGPELKAVEYYDHKGDVHITANDAYMRLSSSKLVACYGRLSDCKIPDRSRM